MIENSEQPVEFLGHERWQMRNAAVKALAKKRSPKNAEALCNIIKDRTPSPWWIQLLGEPLRQVGFIRRNAWQGLENQVLSEDTLGELTAISKDDGYYEVRVQMFKTIRAQVEQGHLRLRPEVINLIIAGLLHEKNFEVQIACIELIPHIYHREQVLQVAPLISRHKQWRVREAFLGILCKMLADKILSKDDVQSLMKSFSMGSDYFRPTFVLKEKRAILDKLLLEAS